MARRDHRRESYRGDPELNEMRYGSEGGRRGGSKFSPRGNDQDWGEERFDRSSRSDPRMSREWRRAEETFDVRGRESEPETHAAGNYGGSMRGRERPDNIGGDIEDYGGTRGRSFTQTRERGSGERWSRERDRPGNLAGDMEDFGTASAAQFGHRDYYGFGEHQTRKFGMHGRGRDQYFASDDDRDWDRGQIVRGPSTQRPRDAGERGGRAGRRGTRDDW
jgi:hypothetical protein